MLDNRHATAGGRTVLDITVSQVLDIPMDGRLEVSQETASSCTYCRKVPSGLDLSCERCYCSVPDDGEVELSPSARRRCGETCRWSPE